jgi:hypothetical protein
MFAECNSLHKTEEQCSPRDPPGLTLAEYKHCQGKKSIAGNGYVEVDRCSPNEYKRKPCISESPAGGFVFGFNRESSTWLLFHRSRIYPHFSHLDMKKRLPACAFHRIVSGQPYYNDIACVEKAPVIGYLITLAYSLHSGYFTISSSSIFEKRGHFSRK